MSPRMQQPWGLGNPRRHNVSIANQTDLELPQGSAAFPFRDWSIHGRLSVEAVSSAEASFSARLTRELFAHVQNNCVIETFGSMFDANHAAHQNLRPPIDLSGSIRGQILKKDPASCSIICISSSARGCDRCKAGQRSCGAALGSAPCGKGESDGQPGQGGCQNGDSQARVRCAWPSETPATVTAKPMIAHHASTTRMAASPDARRAAPPARWLPPLPGP